MKQKLVGRKLAFDVFATILNGREQICGLNVKETYLDISLQ